MCGRGDLITFGQEKEKKISRLLYNMHMIMIDIISLCQMNIYLYGKIGHSIKKQEVTSSGSYKKRNQIDILIFE